MGSSQEQLREKVKEFPTSSGVYLMKNRNEKIIYIGKAKNLKNRVRSYFSQSKSNGKDQSIKTRFLLKSIESIEYILTQTEVEAFLLEASLIKKHRPRYNIRLKDDKSYPYIRFSMQHDFPRLFLSRRVKNDGSLYFGPYTSSYSVREVIKFLNGVFKIRDCRDHVFKSKTRPCLTYEIERCTAPCVQLISKDKYRSDVDRALAFLNGDTKGVIDELKEKMQETSQGEQFEQAARYRDAIRSIEGVLEKQSVVDSQDRSNRDVIGFYSRPQQEGTLIVTVHVRAGRVLGLRSHYLPSVAAEEEDPRDWLVSFVNQYYEDNIIPNEILLPVEIGGDLTQLLQKVLTERRGASIKSSVQVAVANESVTQGLLQMANENAKSRYEEYVDKSQQKTKALEWIQKKLHLPELPMRIECFDVSHFQGSEVVASQVVFEEGTPDKDNYRRYRLKTVEGIDDYKSMAEVLSRRFQHKEYEDPQLIVVDGGKGQLSVAVKVLSELGRSDIPVVGLAKARSEKGTQERFYLPGRQNPVIFAENSMAFQILVGIRDEAHRFAISYHRRLRENTSLQSELDLVAGLGVKRKKTLLKKFKSVQEIKQANVEQLSGLPGFNSSLAESVLQALSEEEH